MAVHSTHYNLHLVLKSEIFSIQKYEKLTTMYLVSSLVQSSM